jgi:hypothetical protein
VSDELEPTGCRLVYPPVGLPEFVHDVLGTDPPPEGWPHLPPTARRIATVRRAELKRAEARAEQARENARYTDEIYQGG